jgi:hypothetical protein
MANYYHNRYGPLFASFLKARELSALVDSPSNGRMRPLLDILTVERAFAGRRVTDVDMARACVAAIHMSHGSLDKADALSAELGTREGHYIHALIHLREGDFTNAAYWMRRVGKHAIHPDLVQHARSVVHAPTIDTAFLREQSEWNAVGFVQLCRMYAGRPSETETLCRVIQMREWELLFNWCFVGAQREIEEPLAIPMGRERFAKASSWV